MVAIESACALVALLLVLVGLKTTTPPVVFIRRYLLLAAASWLAEDTCIHAYHFYAYDSGWSVFLDQMPITIALIWPTVVLSSWEVERHLGKEGDRRLPFFVGAMVFADAWLIEPVAVQSGLWRWFEPGLFEVPVIGVAGWGYFALVSVALLQWVERTRKPPAYEALLLVIAPLGSHLLLLASWWGFFRWVSAPIPSWPAVGLVVALSSALAVWAVRARARTKMPVATFYGRFPAALLFFVLLALFGREEPALVVWVAAFAPPWLVMTPPRRVPSAALAR